MSGWIGIEINLEGVSLEVVEFSELGMVFKFFLGIGLAALSD
jgi:hypothetical protein